MNSVTILMASRTNTGPPIELISKLKAFQKINHFPASMEFCKKDYLARAWLLLTSAFCPREV
jgi:hypothetical protein